MDDHLFNRLTDEVETANKASYANDQFIKPFINRKKAQLFDAFEAVEANNIEALKELKLMSLALSALEADVNSVIDTGKLASETLNQDNEVH